MRSDTRAASRGRGAVLAAGAAVGLLLAACGRGGTEEAAIGALAEEVSWLTDVTAGAGIDFRHESGADETLLLPPIMGAGGAFFDYDGDGDLDVYLVHGGADPRRSSNRLFRQEGTGRFIDVTAASGLGDRGFGMGVAIGDCDNDGDLDVYVTNFGPDALYRNNGDGTFTDVTAEAGIDVAGWSCSAAFFDYDRDGRLDLYVTQYVRFDPKLPCFDLAGRPEYCGPLAFDPVPDVLLHNEGGGRFRDASDAAGISSAAAAGLGVICGDFNDDGWDDVYVANDAYPNHLWLNPGDGTFDESGIEAGVAYDAHGKAEAGMGLVADDLDGDALVDLFVTNLRGETNTFYRNVGSGWLDATGEAGLGQSSLPRTGFGAAAQANEHDGDLDLLVANGRVNRAEALPGAQVDPPLDVLAEPNLFYLNDGAGRFEPATDLVRDWCAPVEISRGIATGDVDGDGDLDVLLTNVHGPARLYRNDAPRQGRWLAVRALDPALRREAIGAQVTVRLDGRVLVATVRRACSYLSSSDATAHFGLGAAGRVQDIEVRWPDGLTERFGPAEADRVIDLVRGGGKAAP